LKWGAKLKKVFAAKALCREDIHQGKKTEVLQKRKEPGGLLHTSAWFSVVVLVRQNAKSFQSFCGFGSPTSADL